ncbi:hypothetical protein DBR43_24705 [Pedobacter sp. KBW06]|uniref:hypothetical protein n=1 Tax=Pedobacter sp. KBW06 TaxID=2153359 RepID=UPI000F5993CF|nr:hypothetical protein [Pedobacter sp. KBW06]RQO67721.1 hypothetical protein DBR43_24705 [Pedobacter sp. KBW06]
MQIPEKNQNEDYEFVNHASRTPKKKISPVALGLIFIAAGLVCSYFFIYQKLQQMAEHSASISYSKKAMILGPMLLIFGLYYAVIRPDDLNVMSPRDKKWLYLFVAVFIVAMIALYEWFKTIASGYGYSL